MGGSKVDISKREARYEAKLRAYRKGDRVVLNQNEFIRYVLELQSPPLGLSWLSVKCGFSFNAIPIQFHSGGAVSSAVPFKLAVLTDQPIAFWQRNTFSPKEADGIVIHTARAVLPIVEPPGSHALRLEREAESSQQVRS